MKKISLRQVKTNNQQLITGLFVDLQKEDNLKASFSDSFIAKGGKGGCSILPDVL
jgi:hypothetical protein